MGALALEGALARIAGKRTYIDANLFIYFFAATPRYERVATALMKAARERQFFAVTGKAVVAEVMVHPYRDGNPEVIARFHAFFAQDFLSVVDHPSQLYDTAALFAGTRRMKLIDALHYATALHVGCEAIVSNDHRFTQQRDAIEVIYLDGLLSE
jgi:predicted nucleic acid-binding protein